MSEKAKALVAETVDQLNKLPDSKKDKAKQMMEAFAAGIAIGAELAEKKGSGEKAEKEA